MNATIIAEEMYLNLKPSENDVLIILYGAHGSPNNKDGFVNFMHDVYDQVALPFAGHTFWYILNTYNTLSAVTTLPLHNITTQFNKIYKGLSRFLSILSMAYILKQKTTVCVTP